MTSINSNAPVKCSKSLTINAGSEKIWAALTNINNWTTWQTYIRKSILNGDLKPGSTFEWQSGGARIYSKLHTGEPFKYFGWTGKTLGIFAIHNWTLKETNGLTIVSVEESMEGFIADILRKSFNNNLDKSVQNWLLLLKQECEK